MKIIISGTARCGKSFLAENIKEDDKVSTFKVDLLLLQSLGYKKPKNSFELHEKLNFYINKTRYVDSKRKKTEILFKNLKFKDIIKTLKFKRNQMMPSYIIDLIDKVNLHNNKNKWIAADLNAEMIFENLKKIKKDLFLIVLMRNPLEAICASLYWRNYPNVCENRGKILLYKLLSWKLTFFVAKILKKKFPRSVKIIFINELKKKRDDSVIFFDERFNLKKSFFKLNYFDFNEQKGTFCPDKKWNHLLKENEIKLIKKMTSIQKGYQNYFLIFFLFILNNSLCFLAKINPLLSKNILDFLFFPSLIIKKSFYSFFSK